MHHSRSGHIAPSSRLCLRTLAALVTLAAVALTAPITSSAQQPDTSYYAGMRWRSIGPYRSGNVYAVGGAPSEPFTYYAGMPEGGVWKTTDGGTVWKPIFDSTHVASIGALAVSESNPNVVYVGTGDPTGWSFTPGKGVYKSTDAGTTWRNIGLDSTHYINAIIVDPHDPNIVVVGALGSTASGGSSTARGIYRSTDGGRTWTHPLYVDAYTGVADMSYDHANPRIMYAAFQRGGFGMTAAQRAQLQPLGAGIYKSTDEGATWTKLSGNGLPSTARDFQVAVASDASGQRVYAEAQGAGRDAGGVYRSDNGGQTWTLGTKDILSAGGPVAVDPHNPDIVYLTGTALYRSTDGAHSFIAYKGSPGGDDIRDIWIDPVNSRRIMLGVDQGPAISVDGGATWTPWYNLPNGQFYRVSTDNHFPYRVCAPQQDSGTACVLSRSDFGEIRTNDWSPIGGFENGFITADPLDDRWVYTQGWYHVLRRYDRTTGQVSVLYTPTPTDRFNGAPPLIFAPQDPHTLYMAAQYVLASSDGGRTWRRASPDLTATQQAPAEPQGIPGRRFVASIQSLAASPVAAGEMWAGTSNGVIQITRNGGKSWTNVTPQGAPMRGAVNIIDPSHSSAGTAYATVDVFGDNHPYVYRTTDFGHTWQKIVDGLPDDALVRVVREDPVDPNLLYAGTVTGAWVSFDRGDHWQSLQLNLPTTVVSDLTVHGSDLVASTYGRALWILDDVTPLRQMRTATASRSPYLFTPASAYRTHWDNTEDTPLPPEIPAGQNPPEGAIVDYYLAAPASGNVTLAIYDSHGGLVRQYSSVAPPPDTLAPNVPMYWFKGPVVLPTGAGMHRIAWDLRYPIPDALSYGYYGNILDYTEYTLNWHSIEGETPRRQPVGPMVAPGTYQVRLTVGGHTYTRDLTLTQDPRIKVSQETLTSQMNLERRITAGMAVSYATFNDIDRVRAALAADSAQAAGKPGAGEVVSTAHALDTRLAALASGPQGGFGPANRDLARHLEDIDFADMSPTQSNITAVETNCREIDDASAALSQVQNSIQSLDALLEHAGMQPLPALRAPAAGACTVHEVR